MPPKVGIIFTEGNNRDQESSYAFETAGAATELVYLNELKNKEKKLDDYQILFLPGGFTYGDDLFSAKIWAAKLMAYCEDQLAKFINSDKLIIGVCNGFQCLVRLGLLPYGNLGKIEATLTNNASGHFEGRWINAKIEKSNCIFTKGMEGKILRLPTSHCEGRFLAPEIDLEKIEKSNQVVMRYVDENGNPTQNYPQNPNGSTNAITGICSPNGKVFGLMPHPECNTKWNHFPNWNNKNERGGEALEIFQNAVSYFK